MAHHRPGHRDRARECFDRAVRRVREREGPLGPVYARELSEFRAEAESILAAPAGEPPEEVFAPAR